MSTNPRVTFKTGNAKTNPEFFFVFLRVFVPSW